MLHVTKMEETRPRDVQTACRRPADADDACDGVGAGYVHADESGVKENTNGSTLQQGGVPGEWTDVCVNLSSRQSENEW